MVESGIGRVPIVDRAIRKVIGIISRQDLLKVHAEQRREEKARPKKRQRP